MKFTEADIKDTALLESMVEKEANNIFSSDAARKGRTFEEVKSSVRQGKIAELYLIETGNFSPANKRWHDLILNETGELCEIKAYNIYSTGAPSVQRDLKRIRTEGWNFSKWYYLFKCNDGVYELLSKIEIR